MSGGVGRQIRTWAAAFIAVGVLALALLGGATYRAVLQSKARTDERRTALAYLTAQVRAHDVRGGIELRDGGRTLVLREEGEGTVYEMRICARLGNLVEEYAPAGSAAAEQDTAVIAKTEAFAASLAGEGLLCLQTDAGQVLVKLYSAQAEEDGS